MKSLRDARFLAAVLALALAPAVLRADTLGVASGYNLFVFGDASRSFTDAEGRVAVGGNANFTSFGVNDKNTGDGPDAAALVVGGNLHQNGGEVFFGSAYVGSSSGSGPGFRQSGQGASLRIGSPIDFAQAEADLGALSWSLSSLAANGTRVIDPYNAGSLTLKGTSGERNVFNLLGTDLNGLNSFNIDAPTGSTILINVSGDPAAFSNYSMFRNGQGVTDTNILWNFVNAGSIAVNGFSFRGSILAPLATLSFGNGNIEGNVIVRSVAAGGGEFHNKLFTGDLPSAGGPGGPGPGPDPGAGPGPGPGPVPAPAGLVLAGIGAACGLAFRRRR